jgi:2-dehydropantoate 2-reductase
MRILVVGAGAVGGYFGGRLASAGADVTFLVRAARRTQIEAEGLSIRSALGDLDLAPRLLGVDEPDAPFDIAILSCKSPGLPAAMEVLEGRLAVDGMILPVLNGVAHLELLTEQFGEHRVLGGLVHIGATVDAEGRILHLNRLNEIRLGALDGGDSSHCEALRQAFASTPVHAFYSRGILAEIWEKYVFLATLSGATCLMRSPLGTIHATPAGSNLVADLLAEAKAIAAAEGHAVSAGGFARYETQLMDPASASTSSMLRDIERGAPTEGDHVLGHLVRLARGHRIAARSLNLAHAHLGCHDHRVGSKL